MMSLFHWDNDTLVVLCINQVFIHLFILSFQYHAEMRHYYSQPGFSGRFARQFLSPPYSPKSSTTDHHQASGSPSKRPLSPQSQRARFGIDNQPRLSLRWLGSYQNIGYLLAGYLFAYMWWGVGPVGFGMMMLGLAVMYGLLMAVVRPKGKSQ